jgi:hypothetical protein
MWQSGVALTVGHVRQHLWVGNLIFGKESIPKYPSGMFLCTSTGGMGLERIGRRVSGVRPSQLGRWFQWALLGLGFAVGLVRLGFS